MWQKTYQTNTEALEVELWEALNDAELNKIITYDELCDMWYNKAKGMEFVNPPQTIHIPLHLHKPDCDVLTYICDGCGSTFHEPLTEREEVYLCDSCILEEDEGNVQRDGSDIDEAEYKYGDR